TCGFNKSAVLRPRDPRSGNSSFLSNLLRSTSPRLLFYKPTPWMQCDYDHIYNLIRVRALSDVGRRSYEVSRESLLRFLNERSLS
ncbi:MAG: hypothetical protein ACLQVY_00815, partial [Limisphaerales bacterium]